MKRLLTVLTILLLTMPVSAQDISKQKKEKKKLENEIALIDKQLNTNKNKRQESLNTLILTRKKIETRKKLVWQIDSEIEAYNKEIQSKNGSITRLDNRLDTLRAHHARLIRGAYKTRDNRMWTMLLLTSKDLNQAIRRWSYMKNISATVRSEAETIQKTEEKLIAEKNDLSALKQEAETVKHQREKELAFLKAEEKKANGMVVSLSKKEKEMKKELERKRKEVEKLNKEIERILAEAVKKQQNNKNDKVDYALSAKFGENKGKLPWPVSNGVIIQKFGQTYHPVFKNLKMPYNNGINISAAAGSEAKCVFDGVVKQILVMPGYDQCVLVQHGEYFTFYCKLKQVFVKSGDKVSTGSRIGIATTNDSGNAELHFQLWKGTQKQNPESWLRK